MLIGNIRKKFDFLHNFLEVDTWKTIHDEDGNMIETYEGKTKIDEMIYLGVDISCDGKNLKKYYSQRKQGNWHKEANREYGKGIW
jgi:hypothetical protein